MEWAPEGDRRLVIVLMVTMVIVFIIGEYGTGPVSYFVFVRFLLLINILLFLVWFAFVCVPQISWRYNEGENMIDQPSRSQLNCLRSCNNSCPSGTITVYSCDSSNNISIEINRCTDDNCGSDDRPKEGTRTVTVCTEAIDVNATHFCVFDNVDPEVDGLQWIVDFVTGQVSWYKLTFMCLCSCVDAQSPCHHVHVYSYTIIVLI